jgi:hypothetical protein
MAQQTINTGTAPNDGTGDTLKTSFTKCNANFTELYGAVASPTTLLLGGRLAYVGPTQLTFLPFNGNKIKINGALYTIPGTGAGIAGLANTGIRLNNVPGSNLAADTTYWVFAENVSGTVTGHFWTVAGGLAAPHHRPSQTAGNEGVEAWYNGTELPQFTLIGMCRTDASAQFVYTPEQRFVRSWVNRASIAMAGAAAAGVFTSYNVGFSSLGGQVDFVCFSDDAIEIFIPGFHDNSAGGSCYSGILVDMAAGTPVGQASYNYSYGATQWAGFCPGFAGYLSEGYHYAVLGAFVSAGSSTSYFQVMGTVG